MKSGTPAALAGTLTRIRQRRLSWNKVLGIEMLTAIGLLMLLCTLAVKFGALAMEKARLTALWPEFRVQRDLMIERLALTGDGYIVPGMTAAAATVDQADDIEAALAFRPARRSAGGSGDGLAEEGLGLEGRLGRGGMGRDITAGIQRQETQINFSIQPVEQSLLINLQLPGRGDRHYLALAPTAPEGQIPGSVLWVCGKHRPLPGWYRLPGPVGTDIPNERLFSICRDQGRS